MNYTVETNKRNGFIDLLTLHSSGRQSFISKIEVLTMLLSIRTLLSLVGITLQPLATLRRRSLMPALTFCSMALGLLSTQSSLNAQSVTFSGTLPVTLSSSFNYPYGVAVDAAGDVFVAEINTASVKEIVAVNGSIPANPTIRTLSSAFNDPIGVAVDTIGNVYVADGNNFVYEIVAVDGAIPSNPTIRTLGSGFNGPGGVAVDGSGNVYVGDSINDAVKGDSRSQRRHSSESYHPHPGLADSVNLSAVAVDGRRECLCR